MLGEVSAGEKSNAPVESYENSACIYGNAEQISVCDLLMPKDACFHSFRENCPLSLDGPEAKSGKGADGGECRTGSFKRVTANARICR